jgi:hypothetical protein
VRARRRRSSRLLAAVAAVALLAAACADGTDPADPADEDGDATADGGDSDTVEGEELAIAFASFDVAVGDDQRVLAGLLTPDRQVLGFGEVEFQLGYLGTEVSGETELTESATATFLPIAGMEPPAEASGERPAPLADPATNGVYEARVDLDEPGYWGLRVIAELEDGRTLEGQTTFPVLQAPLVPAVGDEAPRSENLTLTDVEAGVAQPAALDSRAQEPGAPIPDQHLHDRTIASSIEQGRPVAVVVSTPVYCVSRFCGPLTDVVSDLATEYEDRADFVHIEVWEDFEAQQLNAAAAEWIQTDEGGNEPWVFLVDADGTVAARWDNVLDVAEFEQALEALPELGPAEEPTTDEAPDDAADDTDQGDDADVEDDDEVDAAG